jgi:hypothetical protein
VLLVGIYQHLERNSCFEFSPSMAECFSKSPTTKI